jgi:hypothetical protein
MDVEVEVDAAFADSGFAVDTLLRSIEVAVLRLSLGLESPAPHAPERWACAADCGYRLVLGVLSPFPSSSSVEEIVGAIEGGRPGIGE